MENKTNEDVYDIFNDDVNKTKDININKNINSNLTNIDKNIKPLVEVRNFSKKYSKSSLFVVNNISFNIYPGHFHVFIGENGAGKTTTIKSIISAYSNYKYSGEIKINGYYNYLPEAKLSLGYIPEEAKFPKKMTLKKYLINMSKLSNLTKEESIEKVNKLIKELNLIKLENKQPEHFSSGQKKKVLLAQALIHEPKILIMDEPAANLDPLARMELFETLVNLQKQGKAIFLSSHILDEIEKYATYATILHNGKIVYDGEINNKEYKLIDLYKKYVN